MKQNKKEKKSYLFLQEVYKQRSLKNSEIFKKIGTTYSYGSFIKNKLISNGYIEKSKKNKLELTLKGRDFLGINDKKQIKKKSKIYYSSEKKEMNHEVGEYYICTEETASIKKGQKVKLLSKTRLMATVKTKFGKLIIGRHKLK